VAYGKATDEVERSGSLPVPLRIRNAPTALMKRLGYGRGYRYPHDHADAYVPEGYLPEAIEELRFYEPTERGYEATLGDRLKRWRGQRRRKPTKETA
jgi:putative ATPase